MRNTMKNNRTFLEKLLDGAEVEWKPLKDVAEYIRGVTYNKANESTNNIGYKVLRANNITLPGNTLNFDDIKVIKFDTKVKSSQMLYKNDILISAASGSREHVGKVAFIYQDIDYYFGGFMGVIRCNNNVNSRYLFHIFTSSIFQDYLNEVLNSSTINNLNSKVMDSFRLPIPPLSVQTEIVKILDALTELTSELTSELILRRKQYEYYREKLLSHDSSEYSTQKSDKVKFFHTSNIQWLHLNEIYKFQYGIGNKIPTIGGKYPVYGSNGIVGSHNEYNSEDAPVIGHIGAYAGIVNWAEGKHFVTYNGIICNKINDNVNSRYAYYLLLSQNFIDKANKASQPFISYDILNKCIVPVPPLKEQQRIVSILDKFETLTNSITEGLPLAIEQSQKRYEYYRELLLNFS